MHQKLIQLGKLAIMFQYLQCILMESFVNLVWVSNSKQRGSSLMKTQFLMDKISHLTFIWINDHWEYDNTDIKPVANVSCWLASVFYFFLYVVVLIDSYFILSLSVLLKNSVITQESESLRSVTCTSQTILLQ